MPSFYSWQIELIQNCTPRFYLDGNQVYPINDGFILPNDADHEFKIEISCAVRSLVVEKDGIEVFNSTNVTEQDVVVGNTPCTEYTPESGVACKTGYTKEGGIRIVYQIQLYYSNIWNTRPTNITSTVNPIHRSDVNDDVLISSTGPSEETVTSSGTPVRYLVSVFEDNTRCVPGDNCPGEDVIEQQEVWNGQPLVYKDGVNPSSQPEITLPVITPTPPTNTTPQRPNVDAATTPEQSEQYISQLIKQANDLGQSVTFGPGSGLPKIQRQDSKYRIISPETYSQILGKFVPDVRYESVRYLSPEAASNFISRGYELLSVSPDTPESTSKPYSQSVIQRQRILTGQNKIMISGSRERNRLTITQASGNYNNKNNNRIRTPQNRYLNRRRVIR